MNDTTNLKAGWLSDVPVTLADRLTGIGRLIDIPRGQAVFGLGSDTSEFYGVAQGVVRLEVAANGNEQRLGQFFGPGYWFGELRLIAEMPRLMGAVAATDVRLMQITQSGFNRLANEFPDLWRCIALLSAQHMAMAIGAADDLMLSSPQKRIAAVLLRFAGRRHANPAIQPNDTIPVTQQEIAAAANMSRASAGNILRQMAAQGQITIEYGALLIRDPEALAATTLN